MATHKHTDTLTDTKNLNDVAKTSLSAQPRLPPRGKNRRDTDQKRSTITGCHLKVLKSCSKSVRNQFNDRTKELIFAKSHT